MPFFTVLFSRENIRRTEYQSVRRMSVRKSSSPRSEIGNMEEEFHTGSFQALAFASLKKSMRNITTPAVKPHAETQNTAYHSFMYSCVVR
jgi:hypothetical protein